MKKTKDWNELSNPTENRNRRFVRRIRMTKVKDSLRWMKMGKVMGLDEIPIEAWKWLGDVGVCWLTNIFNTILSVNKMPSEWRWSTLIPIYKNKGDTQNYTNYCGIKLKSHIMKLWERVIEYRFRHKIKYWKINLDLYQGDLPWKLFSYLKA